MQINRISNAIDTNIYDEGSRRTSDSEKNRIGNKKTESVEQLGKKKYTEDELIDTIESANEQFIAYDRRFEFSIHEKTKQIMVKIIDVSTDEIIREIPPEKILDLVAAIWEISGIIVDERI